MLSEFSNNETNEDTGVVSNLLLRVCFLKSATFSMGTHTCDTVTVAFNKSRLFSGSALRHL